MGGISMLICYLKHYLWVGELDEDGQKVQTFSYKIKKYWGCKVQHDDYS